MELGLGPRASGLGPRTWGLELGVGDGAVEILERHLGRWAVHEPRSASPPSVPMGRRPCSRRVRVPGYEGLSRRGAVRFAEPDPAKRGLRSRESGRGLCATIKTRLPTLRGNRD